ncbi:hypothetical protein VCHA51O444_10666 [Vibrio chagasii]|nr:hypothetical protein VCHA51O444_10666 [Vibrio chagasii]
MAFSFQFTTLRFRLCCIYRLCAVSWLHHLFHAITVLALTLIPFGLHTKTNEYLPVSEVKRGKACECICPSCKIPLIARQPDKTDTVWHFAHSSKAIYKDTREKCEYNFYLSLRMFSRQIIGSGFKITTPDFYKTIIKTTGLSYPTQMRHTFKVAQENTLTLENVETEVVFNGVHVDFLSRIGEFNLIIYLTHPDREFPEHLLEADPGPNTAILEIGLLNLYHSFIDKSSGASHRFLDCVREHLESNLEQKEWRLHPREQRLLSDAEAYLDRMIADRVKVAEKLRSNNQHGNTGVYLSDRLSRTGSSRNYKCSSCTTTWPKTEGYICPLCQSRAQT